ncbi:MAG: hypothetical protein QOF98_3359, partial [Streptomyces sp.]|nr:hypothetical protein [Streptomyces sp.]
LADLGVPVAHAVVSATRPPDRQRLDVNRIRTMSRADWLAELATADFLGSEATPAEAEEIADLMIPVLRADHLLLARYRPTYRPSTVPLLALGGSADPWITPTHLAGWQRWATGAFQTRTLPGGHFYYRDQLDEFCELIRTGPLPLFRSAEKAARS